MGKVYRGTSWGYWFNGHLNGYRPYTDGKYIITYSSLKRQWEVWTYKDGDLGTVAAGVTWKTAVDNFLNRKKRK